MGILTVVLGSAALLIAAYLVYGRLLGKLFQLDDSRPTPAVTLRDGVDYEPIPPRFLIGQHFSAIAAAGPVVGPILAGTLFGWGPALAWILIGCIFIGGVHDLGSLVASIRHKGKSLAEVVKQQMSRRAYVLFLLFVYIALVYIVVAFTDIVATSFVVSQPLEDGTIVTGAGIASSSLMYLALPVIMGLCMRYARLSLGWATLIFVPLVGVAIAAGQSLPVDLAAWFNFSPAHAVKLWGGLLILYCVLASVAPVWALLQPRGHLGGIFLYLALIGGSLGLIIGAATGELAIQYPAFTAWTVDGASLAPILFITIACGACSGFHCLIASGTTSKQLRRESDARLVGYGTMLMEGMVAIISLACVMVLARGDTLLAGSPPPANLIYAQGIARFLDVFAIPAQLGVVFGLLAFTTFVYDTLDVCTRLGRFIVQELTGWKDAWGRWFGTIVTAAVPLIFLFLPTPIDAATGRPKPVWSWFWSLFGASNQLLAALALLSITVWLWRTRRARWVWPVMGIPTLLMYVMSIWALTHHVRRGFLDASGQLVLSNPVAWAALALIILAALLLVEAVAALRRGSAPSAAPIHV